MTQLFYCLQILLLILCRYFVRDHGSDEINFSLVRGKEPIQIKVIPEMNTDTGNPMVGISMDTIGTLSLPIHKALWEGLKLSGDLTIKIAVGFYALIRDGLTGQGDLVFSDWASRNCGCSRGCGIIWVYLFTFIYGSYFHQFGNYKSYSISSSRWRQTTLPLIEKIKGSRIKPAIANWVNMIGFGILMLFMAVITYNDIVKLF
jgi:hypothetical protein